MSLLPTTPSTTPTSSTKTSNTSNSSASSTSQLDLNNQIAGNFNEFLGLLTTQLQNQDPLSPMDTNQFTQQLVEFASVEQQINMNTNLQTLVTLQQTAQDSQALGFVGQTVTVNGSTAALATGGKAQWTYNPTSPATATFTVTNSAGATVFTQSGTVQPGSQQFTWNGQNNSGQQQPAGNYTLKITATDANGKSVAVPTTVTGVVQSVDLSKNPPELNIGGQNYTVNQIVNVTQSSNSLSSLQSSLSNISSQLGTLTSQLSSLL
ncbi:MAG TPA: flagellar hook capping FlgD N-terminal domain-containing protein [Xanthobacteraceae bacterium]|nr:flagellar hook capping FlgD N-terminal domain-containing protein [Xanthobacteraceae bacterium]